MPTVSSSPIGPTDVPTTPAQTDPQDLDSVYQALVQGVGHELVTDANVEALIRRAEADHHPVLAAELREWRSPCGDDSGSTPAG
ncbi:hypothetical protein [Pelomonas cellulosilytica]|uniref:Uncharacterized protein n=1 Tax=Pelomonas cellulosilytica TaxID=2906762 RepID=A0ABS8XNY4_9BURK|nr:hypothetical protein [Pelomonas sp. P8]MCE4553460.1 hypothetical protein [Pelomonas sp. P8]